VFSVIPDNIFVSGLGVHVPDVVSVETAIAQGAPGAEEAAAVGLLGAAVSPETSAPEMGLAAARQALQRAGRSPDRLDALFYVDAYDAGPEGWLPHFHLQRHLVGGDLLATGIRQGCNGMFGALELAASYLQANAEHGAALLVAADNFSSPDVDRWRCARPSLVLADGASALVVAREGFARLASVASMTLPDFEGMHRGDQPLLPAGRQLDFGDRLVEFEKSGVDQSLWMSYLAAPPKLVGRLLDEAGIGKDDVRWVMMHNASREFIENGLLNLIEMPLSRTTWDFGRRIGHLGASDHPASLEHLLTTGRLVPGDHVLAFGNAPGLGLAGAVFEIVDLPAWARGE
jgi:3-oxoacyl-[acyl-carrier-protein] synthase III